MNVQNISLDGFVMRQLNVLLQCLLFDFWKDQALLMSE
jgi:hypothetical protein